MQSVQSVTRREGDDDTHLRNMLDVTEFYWVGLYTHTYSSALPIEIEHAFTRVIIQRRVKTEIYEWYCCTVRPCQK